MSVSSTNFKVSMSTFWKKLFICWTEWNNFFFFLLYLFLQTENNWYYNNEISSKLRSQNEFISIILVSLHYKFNDGIPVPFFAYSFVFKISQLLIPLSLEIKEQTFTGKKLLGSPSKIKFYVPHGQKRLLDFWSLRNIK